MLMTEAGGSPLGRRALNRPPDLDQSSGWLLPPQKKIVGFHPVARTEQQLLLYCAFEASEYRVLSNRASTASVIHRCIVALGWTEQTLLLLAALSATVAATAAAAAPAAAAAAA
jgi:hypothetical protein